MSIFYKLFMFKNYKNALRKPFPRKPANKFTG